MKFGDAATVSNLDSIEAPNSDSLNRVTLSACAADGCAGTKQSRFLRRFDANRRRAVFVQEFELASPKLLTENAHGLFGSHTFFDAPLESVAGRGCARDRVRRRRRLIAFGVLRSR